MWHATRYEGYLAGGEERRYAFSYTYRDYVVRAFNRTSHTDQFLIEQIAADKLQMGEDKRRWRRWLSHAGPTVFG